MAIQVVILAAGQGKRMHSTLPKVLHPLAGKSLIEHVITTSQTITKETVPVIVYGHQAQIMKERLGHLDVRLIEQKQQLGTGHAVQEALTAIGDHDDVLILYGDVPLISEETLKQLIDTAAKQNVLAMLTAHLQNPAGYGRIKRDDQRNIVAIIEEQDADDIEKQITEINPGIYFVSAAHLKRWLPTLKNDNAQGEYYLTDIIKLAKSENMAIKAISPQFAEEILGVNNRVQLAQLERFKQRQLAEKLMQQGVTIYDPARFDIRGEVTIGADTSIDINVICEGRVIIGRECVIGANVILRNTMIGDRSEIKANSVIDGAEIAADCLIGPFARVRPGSVIGACAHVGNFVEIKNSMVDEASKINHLSYIGDSEIGKRVNIGAGTITCNYDGVNKHKTMIGDDVFIGSDTQLVAPVSVGSGATIGAGSTITKNVPAESLTLTHQLKQRSFADWQRKEKVRVEE